VCLAVLHGDFWVMGVDFRRRWRMAQITVMVAGEQGDFWVSDKWAEKLLGKLASKATGASTDGRRMWEDRGEHVTSGDVVCWCGPSHEGAVAR